MNRVRIGVIGTGFMARAHVSGFQLDERAILKAVASRRRDRAREFADEFGFERIETEWEALVADPNVDLIDVTAPNYLHAEMAITAARAGKAIIMEKPLATTPDEADRVMATIHETGVLAMYAENRRFAPVFDDCRRRIARGEIGSIKLFRINEMGSGPGHAGWFRNRELAGGGALIDMGIHGLGLVEWLIGSSIRSVSAMVTPIDEAEEVVVTNARFDSGALGQFVCSWGVQGGLDIRAEIFGSTGTLMIDHAIGSGGLRAYHADSIVSSEARPHTASGAGWSFPSIDEWNMKGHRAEVRHFVDCYLAGTPCRCTFEDGYRALQLVFAVYRSATEQREITVGATE